MEVRYSYLKQQFENCDDLWDELKKFVPTGDFTLGKPLQEFEGKFAKLMGTKHAIGVNSGTDAIKLSLKALGVGFGDEVITTANTFVATVGAIAELGAKPVFVDCNDTFCMDVDLLERAITEKTKAIVPVHFTGYMTDMRKVLPIAEKHKLPIVEDACQSILGAIDNKKAGTWGNAGAFSLHPLKNLNVWSDGGVIVTNDDKLAFQLNLLRNHGLIDRDNVEILGYNSRLDTIQAVVGNWLIPNAVDISNKRIENANYYDKNLSTIPGITLPPRPVDFRIVYHLYIVFAEKRDQLLEHCVKKGIEAKVHYPIPIYRQRALASYGYKEGDFPVTDGHTKNIITFPCDQHLSKEEMDYVISTVKEFYAK
ncbi:DegT/DnrJ/EryC1/StrS family aminotransferase [Leptospira ilyithenensis]|uniref:DegT/DnrJ/EryC1/StrS family aminotransferase n=1 Tax=Leptospira ilyithenensis TaxID=2484901 RepID=A0A4R9LMV7_9LEPT|nr:DegT/DnrJ/EryC1/StrS family aminotransferase [Leptospira ilyithenensis]TGN07979.1 DegT/DnrJ/EryC1/StrS family aminotransferase [Leptospira ilyithenensis]